METAVSNNASKIGHEVGYGLHNYSSRHKNWLYREHNGGVNGGITELAYLPEANVGHVIMINSDDFSTFTEISKLIRDFETRNMTPNIVEKSVEISAKHKDIEGLYYPINPRMQMSYFIDRIANVQQLWIDGDKLARKSLLGGKTNYYYADSDGLYKSIKTGYISLSQATDPLAGDVIHIGTLVLKSTSSLLVYTQLSVVMLWGIFILSSMLFFPVWSIRKYQGKIASGATIRIRLWPLLAGLSVILSVVLFTVGGNDPFKSFGEPSFYSVGILLLSIGFALFACLGLYTSVKEWNTKMHQGTFWYSTLSSLIHTVVAIYLLIFGVIGIVLWA